MLYIMKHVTELNIQQLQKVYAESIYASGNAFESESAWLDSLHDFFKIEGAMIALWSEQDVYVSALRLEPYLDGFLLTCLETAPDARGKGFATALVQNVCSCFHKKIYSHIMKYNQCSLSVHRTCGFAVIKDYAKLLDGTVSQRYFTLCKEK